MGGGGCMGVGGGGVHGGGLGEGGRGSVSVMLKMHTTEDWLYCMVLM